MPPLQYHYVTLDQGCAASSTGRFFFFFFQKLGCHKVTLWETQKVCEKTPWQLGGKKCLGHRCLVNGGQGMKTKHVLAF